MIVDKIFNALKQQDQTLTRSKFSREYLGRDSNYWFVCRARQKDISDSALLKLYGQLKKRVDDPPAMANVGEEVGMRRDGLNQLVYLAWAELERRASDQRVEREPV